MRVPARDRVEDLQASGGILEIKVDASGNPLLDQFAEEGFVDCVLRVSRFVETDDSYRFHLAASFQAAVVGLDVSVKKGIRAGLDAEMNLIQEHVSRDGIRFFRSGPEGDLLVAALAKLYGLELGPIAMVDEACFTGIALHQGEIDLIKGGVKIKLFGHDKVDDDPDYNESYFNLDLPNGLVFWNEKDPEYRQPLVRALTRRNGKS